MEYLNIYLHPNLSNICYDYLSSINKLNIELEKNEDLIIKKIIEMNGNIISDIRKCGKFEDECPEYIIYDYIIEKKNINKEKIYKLIDDKILTLEIDTEEFIECICIDILNNVK